MDAPDTARLGRAEPAATFTILRTAACITLALIVLALARGPHVPLRMASRLWAPGLLIGAGARLDIEGAERIGWSRPHVIVANHQSMIDICAMFRAAPVPLRFVIKEELCEPIETSSAEPDRQALAHRAHEAVERLLSETNG